MKLYREVKIESAEQAEALDPRTPYLTVLSDGRVIEAGLVGEEDVEDLTSGGDWHSVALVPFEAEEEFTAMGSESGEPWIAHVGHDGIDGSREEAQQHVDRHGGFIARRALTRWEEA